MTNNIRHFKNFIPSPARTNKYLAQVYPPVSLKFDPEYLINSGAQMAAKTLNAVEPVGEIFKNMNPSTHQLAVLCRNVKMPSMSLGTAKVDLNGVEYFVRDKITFSESVELSFYDNRDGYIRKLFDDWLYFSNKFDSVFNYSTMDNSNYYGNLFLSQLGGTQEENTKFELVGVFPTHVTSTDYDSNKGDIVEVLVTFSYNKFTRLF